MTNVRLLKGRAGILNAIREHLQEQGYLEVQTPILHPHFNGLEKGLGFSTFSASLGERLWFRGAPELYLKRLMISGETEGLDKVFELAICLRDEFNESTPRDSFDRPELTLLELYSSELDTALLKELLQDLLQRVSKQLTVAGIEVPDLLTKTWSTKNYGTLLSSIDDTFELDALLNAATSGSGDAASIEARASDARLHEAASSLAYKAGNMAPYLRLGPQGYWHDLVDHAFQTKVAPTLIEPTLVHGFPLESSPLAESTDAIHCDKWELYAGGIRIALAQTELMNAEAQKVRFEHLQDLRALGYDVLPEPDDNFVAELERWPSGKSLAGMGLYIDRLAGLALGLISDDGSGQERMIPNLYKKG
ncbi:hypothetical protein M1O29_01420 [Dehalococcoidia bacterium]|nr:hypothetical protein [Dehalococcoidia bacterium]